MTSTRDDTSAPPLADPSRFSHFVVATPSRSVCDHNARALERIGQLRLIALGTRKGTRDIPIERTKLKPAFGFWTYLAGRVLSGFQAESFRFRLLPWFDRWVLRQLEPGDHLISSYGYTNESFAFVRRHGGKTLLDGGNSHIENFWQIMSEEHRRWNCPYPPVSPSWYERARAMLAEVDYVLSPSSYVTRSFLDRGFEPQQILRNVYPVDLSLFRPPTTPRPKDRPLTIINTGTLSLRKGTPYLLEAFRIIRQQHPSARLLLTRDIRNDVEPILTRYRDLPIDWAAGMPHARLVERLHSADVFALPSLEEGLVRTALEAMACGLQVVLTPHCGANDFVKPGINGEVVPIRDAKATAEGILRCWERVQNGERPNIGDLAEQLSFKHFEQEFISQLRHLGLVPQKAAV